MGSTCGCLAKEIEEEIPPFHNDITSTRLFPILLNDAADEQIQVPVIDLERKFTEMIDSLTITSSTVRVLSSSHL